MGLYVGSALVSPATQETPSDAKSVSDPDPLSYVKPQPRLDRDAAQSSRHVLRGESRVREINFRPIHGRVAWGYLSARVGRNQQLPLGHTGRVPGCGRPHSTTGVRLLKKAKAQIARRDQRIQVREEEIKKLDQEIKSIKTVETEVHDLRNKARNLETLLEAEVDMKKAAEAKNVGLAKELESLRAQIKAAFEEFKKYKDNLVSSRCAEMDARLDALSIDFDEELYPHMLTAIAGRQWVIGHGLRLAVMKCAESTKLRQVFADVVSAGIVKGMSEGLKHGVEHGEAKLDLAAIEAYDPEADVKYVSDLQALKDLKFPLVDQLEKLKDATIDLIMTSLHLESDFREDDAIATNISRAEKKKKCRVVCRTHGVGSTHHARSDGIPVSMPTVAPQGLAILLVDAATQT
ncbi:hypothetical protein Tco_1167245 [Tanacetum coccineum]